MDTSRFIVVDDTDPLIQYEGPAWFLDDTGSQDKKGNFGPVYNKTLHGTQVGSSLSFSFNGTQFGIIGTNNIRNTSGVLDPAWECYVDGTKVDSRAFAFFENNWRLCGHQPLTLSDGPHTVTLNVSVQGSVPFFFDRIEYTPSANVDLDDKTVYVPGSDPAVQFSVGWGNMGDTANATTQADALLMFDFYGISVSWYGYIPRSTQPSSGIYTIDDNPPTPFILNARPEGSTLYNMEYFRTPNYPKGQHRLTVSYLGGPSGAAPLLLDYFLVRNTTSEELKNPNVTGPTIGAINKNDKTPNPNMGAIIGGVLGGLAMLLLAVLVFLYIRKRSKQPSSLNLHQSSHGRDIDAYALESTSIVPLIPSFGRHFKTSTQPSAQPQPYIHSKFRPLSRSSSPSSAGYQPQEQYLEASYLYDAVGTALLHQPHPQYPITLSSQPAPSRYSSSSTPLLDTYHVTQFPIEVGHTPQEIPNQSPAPLNQALNPRVVVMHEDSGLRNLPAPPDGEALLEIPPTYTMR